MKKLLIAALPLFSLLAGCTGEIDAGDGDEDVAEDEQAVTSFFNGGDSGSTLCASGAPIVKNPQWIGGRVYVDAAGSCIMTGATMKLMVPFTVNQHGPYSMSFDESATRLRSPSLGASVMPSGTCRMVQVTNPNGLSAYSSGFCR